MFYREEVGAIYYFVVVDVFFFFLNYFRDETYLFPRWPNNIHFTF